MAFYENYANICKSLGLSPSTIAKEVAGKNSHADWKKRDATPSTETIIKLVNRLHCSADKLLFGKDPELLPKHKQIIDIYEQLSPEFKDMSVKMFETFLQVQIESENKSKTKTTIIKHSVHKVSAGTGYNLDDDDAWKPLKIVKTPEAEQATFALTVDGDSMSPMFEEGDIILVKEQPAVEINDFCIYTINDEGFFKKYDGNRLISLNPKYKPIVASKYDFVKCWGKVLGKAILPED